MNGYTSASYALILLLVAAAATATDYTGSYVARSPDGDVTLDIEQDADGTISGQLGDGYVMMDLRGEIVGDGIRGEAADDDGEMLGFAAQFEGVGNLSVRLYPKIGDDIIEDLAETLVFVPTASTPSAVRGDPAPTTTGVRQVYINGTPLEDEVIRALETQYGIPIEDGHYWYDAACGAWGVEGGPTAGFIVAGLALPGPMPAKISGGGTDIFINGREIHPEDQVALQNIFGYTMPGRYWLDARGNLGQEGGPPLTSLASAMQASQQGQGGGSVTHGYGQGGGARGTLAGGMYSGRTASGKSVLWYPGM